MLEKEIFFLFNVLISLVLSCLQSIGHISDAHVNPAITVGAVVLGKISLQKASIYFVSQCLGGIMGYGFIKVCFIIKIEKSMYETSINQIIE